LLKAGAGTLGLGAFIVAVFQALLNPIVPSAQDVACWISEFATRTATTSPAILISDAQGTPLDGIDTYFHRQRERTSRGEVLFTCKNAKSKDDQWASLLTRRNADFALWGDKYASAIVLYQLKRGEKVATPIEGITDAELLNTVAKIVKSILDEPSKEGAKPPLDPDQQFDSLLSNDTLVRRQARETLSRENVAVLPALLRWARKKSTNYRANLRVIFVIAKMASERGQAVDDSLSKQDRDYLHSLKEDKDETIRKYYGELVKYVNL
jgi:hypothetical protein